MAGFKFSLSEKEAQTIAAQALKDSGFNLRDYGQMLGGHSGSIFYLDSDQGERVVTNIGFEHEEAAYRKIQGVLGLLADRGVSLSRPIGEVGAIGQNGDKKIYRTSEFVKGFQINKFSLEQVRSLARQLALVHSSTAEVVEKYGWLKSKPNMLGQTVPSNIWQKYQKVKETVADDDVLLAVVDKAASELFSNAKIRHAKLPIGVRHGDFKGKNIVFKTDNEPVLIDWEHLDCGVLLSEVAFAMQEACYTRNRFDRIKADAFLEEYNKLRPLLQTEIEALPKLLVNCSKLHNLLRGIGIGIKWAGDPDFPLPTPQDRLVMHKSLEEYAHRADFQWLNPINKGTPREEAENYTKKPQILIWVESRSGAGHINVITSVAKGLNKYGYDVSVVTSSTGYAKRLGLDKYARIIELPGFLVDQPEYAGSKEDRYRDRDLTIYGTDPLEDQGWNRQRAEILIEALTDIQPDVFITEEYPTTRHPVYSYELESALGFIDSNNSKLERRPLIVAIVKDIALATNRMIKDPAGGSPEAASRIIDRFYDQILVRGDEKVIPVWETATYLADHKDKVIHLGYMINTGGHSRDKSIDEKSRKVIISTGGSFDKNGYNLVKKAIMARGLSEHLRDHKWKIFIAQDCPIDEFEKVTELAKTQGGFDEMGEAKIAVVRNGPEYKRDFANAAVAVIRAGYNAVNEAIMHYVPAVIVPRPTSLEQNLRAKVFCDSSRGRFQKVSTEDDAQKLAQSLDAAYKSANNQIPLSEIKDPEVLTKQLQAIEVMLTVQRFEAENQLFRKLESQTRNQHGIRSYKARFVFENITSMHIAVGSFRNSHLGNCEEHFSEDIRGWVLEGTKKVDGSFEAGSYPSKVRIEYFNHVTEEQGELGGGTIVIESDNERLVQEMQMQASRCGCARSHNPELKVQSSFSIVNVV